MGTTVEAKEAMKGRMRDISVDAFSRGNFTSMDEIYAPNVVRHQPPFPDLNGLEAFKGFVRAIRGAYEDLTFEVNVALADGAWTLLHARLTGTHTGASPIVPVSPTGRPMDITAAILSRWEEGKIVEEWANVDYLGLFQQLGAVPAPGRG